MNIPSYHKDLGNLHIGCEKPRAYYIPYHSEEAALSGNREKSELFSHFAVSGILNFTIRLRILKMIFLKRNSVKQ